MKRLLSFQICFSSARLVVPALRDLPETLRICAPDVYRVLRKTVCGLFTYSLREFDLLRNGAFWNDTGSFRFLRKIVLAVIFFTRVRRESVMSVLLRTHNLSLSPTERGYVVYDRFARDVVWFEVMSSDKLLSM